MIKMKKRIVRFLGKPLGKMILEILRWGVFAFVSTIVAKGIELLPSVEGVDPSLIIYLTMALRFIDSLLHKSGWAEKGISRF